MSASLPSSEEQDPKTVPRFPQHPSGGVQESWGPWDEIPAPLPDAIAGAIKNLAVDSSFRFIGIGSPESHCDPHGILVDPPALRCDVCGQFFSAHDLSRNGAVHRMTVPDSAFGGEEWETLCPKHRDQ